MKTTKVNYVPMPTNLGEYEDIRRIISIYKKLMSSKLGKMWYFKLPKNIMKMRDYGSFYKLNRFIKSKQYHPQIYLQGVFDYFPRRCNRSLTTPYPNSLIALEYLYLEHLAVNTEVHGSFYGASDAGEVSHIFREVARDVLLCRKLAANIQEQDELELIKHFETQLSDYFILLNKSLMEAFVLDSNKINQMFPLRANTMKLKLLNFIGDMRSYKRVYENKRILNEFIDNQIEQDREMYEAYPCAFLNRLQHELEQIDYRI